MNIQEAVEYLKSQIDDPCEGLPQDVFYFISRIVPMVNVDLLIKDDHGRILLSWRDDGFAKAGWHIPGGIIRFKEKFETRIQKVAQFELGTTVECDSEPVAMNQVIRSHETRGHFISFLYQCKVPDGYVPKNDGLSEGDLGYLKWHDFCPEDLVDVHEMYRKFL